MLSQLRHRARTEEGFTLVELLVVILIIGILAAIAIPNFLGQRSKANDAAAKSNARNAISAVESCFTDAQSYSTCGDTALTAGGLTAGTAAGQVKSVPTSDGTGYTITAYSQTNNQFQATSTAGTITYKCVIPSNGKTGGGCAANNGSW